LREIKKIEKAREKAMLEAAEENDPEK
jgi:hypothetical protein